MKISLNFYLLDFESNKKLYVGINLLKNQNSSKKSNNYDKKMRFNDFLGC